MILLRASQTCWSGDENRIVAWMRLPFLCSKGLTMFPCSATKGWMQSLSGDWAGYPFRFGSSAMMRSVVEAAIKLFRAARSKNAAVMFLIAKTTEHQQALLPDLPPGVVVVKAPAVAIKGYLSAQEGADKAAAS